MAADRGKAILQYLGIVVIQNLDDIPEGADQQNFIQMGCMAITMMPMPMTAFPHRIIIGGGMPVLSPIAVATVSADDLIGKQGE